jgi:endonuclease YncB( thermonuclease family)
MRPIPRLIALSLILAAGCSAPAQAPAEDGLLVDGARLYVHDGDTVRLVTSERVRLAGIDAPDFPPRAECEREVRLALEAKARLLELVRAADQVSLHRPPGEPRDADRYGRLLRDLQVDGRDAGDILVAEGLAQVWRGRKAEWCEGEPDARP